MCEWPHAPPRSPSHPPRSFSSSCSNSGSKSARASSSHTRGARAGRREWRFELRRERRRACARRDRRRAHAARARYGWKGAQLGHGAEPRGTTDRTSTHTHATPRARSLLHAGAVAVEAATDDARDHARLPTRAEITRECGGVRVTSAQRSADPAMRTLLTYSHVAGRFVVMRARRDEEIVDEREKRREEKTRQRRKERTSMGVALTNAVTGRG